MVQGMIQGSRISPLACALLVAGMMMCCPALAAPADDTPVEVSETALPARVLPPPIAKQPTGVVTHIIDGDTVRLACVDAPDMLRDRRGDRRPDESVDADRERNFRVDVAPPPAPPKEKGVHAGPQYYAEHCREVLVTILKDRRVTLLAAAPRVDRLGRIVADLQLEGGETVSRHLVQSGLAYVVWDPDFPEEYQEDLLQCQLVAIRSRTGFWARLLAIDAARQPYTGSKETRLFYASSDVRSQKIKPRNRVYFGNLLDAFSAGFAPARPTDFWPPEHDGKEGAKPAKPVGHTAPDLYRPGF